jgi:hypothetical protein
VCGVLFFEHLHDVVALGYNSALQNVCCVVLWCVVVLSWIVFVLFLIFLVLV